jgi:hypothetical protein
MDSLKLGALELDFFPLQKRLIMLEFILVPIYRIFAQKTQFFLKSFVKKNSNILEKTLRYKYEQKPSGVLTKKL